MNQKRKVVILIAASLLTLSGAFPNWVERKPKSHGIQYNPLGRAFLLKGPTERYYTRELPPGFTQPEREPTIQDRGVGHTLTEEYRRREEEREEAKITVRHTRRLPGFIDYKRMFLEWAVILIPSAALWFVFSGPDRPNHENPSP